MKTKVLQRAVRAALVMAICTACSVRDVDIPDDVADVMPVQVPVRSKTGFTPGLECMDQMFLKYKVRPIRITTAQIPDYSENRGDAGFGAREMLISALSGMSQKSGALRFVAYDRSTPDIIALQSAHPRKQDFAVPDFFIRGAVTQIDTTPYSAQNGYSLSMDEEEDIDFNSGQLSHSNSASLKSIAVDLNMGLINTFELLPGIYSSNTLTVEKRGKSDDVSLSIWKLGAVYTLNESRTQALSSGLRSLMEVAAIEIFGKLYNLPYWECLAILGTDSEIELKARKKYEGLDRKEQLKWVASALKKNGLLEKSALATTKEKVPSDQLRQAVAQYQVKNGFFGNGNVDFQTFAALYKQMHISAMASKKKPSASVGKLSMKTPMPDNDSKTEVATAK